MVSDRLIKDVLQDSYFKELYEKLRKMFARHTLVVRKEVFSSKELKDILRFADILSSSNQEDTRNLAYRIISLLKDIYKSNNVYLVYSNAILKKLSNFPALKNTDSVDLPIDRELEFKFSKQILKTPVSEMYFTPSQYRIYNKMNKSKFFSFAGPTSMGKSFIIKQFILNSISKAENKNFCIVVPTRALIKQYVIDLYNDLKGIENKEYKILTNSNILDFVEYQGSKFIFVLTPERLMSLVARKEDIKLDYLIIDEAHKIFNNDTRGLTYYTSIDMSINKYNELKVFFSSPLVKNPEIFKKIYYQKSSDIVSVEESPVTQNLFFVDLMEKRVKFLDKEAYDFNMQKISYMSSKNELMYELGKNCNNIVYNKSRKFTILYSEEFSRYIKEREIALLTSEELEEVRKLCKLIADTVHKDYYLIDCLQQGIAYHNSKLPTIIKEKVEDLFRKGVIKYLFCTNTLLEGVNLPAKNIFVLANYIGTSKMTPIDFWNLAGRAGRLGYEYYGNIFCIRHDDRQWKDLKLLEEKGNIKVEDVVEKSIGKYNKEIKETIMTDDIRTSLKKDEEYSNYLANIIQIDSISKVGSSIVKQSEIIDKNILEACRTIDNKVSLEVLNVTKSIDIKIQNNILENLFIDRMPTVINKDVCRSILQNMYRYYRWDIKEKRLKHINSMKYFAMLMNQWINDVPLSQIIAYSIDYNYDKNCSIEVEHGKYEKFNKNNKLHVNLLINKIISNIEDVLRFDFEKYFNHYYLILKSKFGEENIGPNWSVFLEFGTRNTKNILLQNLGFSRYSANLLLKNYQTYLNFSEENLDSINKDILNSEAKENGILINELLKFFNQ